MVLRGRRRIDGGISGVIVDSSWIDYVSLIVWMDGYLFVYCSLTKTQRDGLGRFLYFTIACFLDIVVICTKATRAYTRWFDFIHS